MAHTFLASKERGSKKYKHTIVWLFGA